MSNHPSACQMSLLPHSFTLFFFFFNLAIVCLTTTLLALGIFLVFFFCSCLHRASHLFYQADHNAHSVRLFPAFKIKGCLTC